MSEVRELAGRAQKAAVALANTSTDQRNRALLAMAHALVSRQDEILEANARDMEAARVKNTGASLLDRLELNPMRIKAISEALKSLSVLPDPIGEVVSGGRLGNGIWLQQVRVPIGVVAIIYEARPNVTADAAGLCIKTGNAVVLRGGSLAVESNLAITKVLAAAAVGAGLPEGCIASISSTDREAA
ncbi:MAG: aldehyde dehydrogenase family protein, partial [Actinomycetota bacterium]|nr:aldehyde dehydrogenase family protein [Actinomycetota bacterium]